MIPSSVTQYLLESSIGLALFYALYYFLLRRETFFQFNRVYLLLMPAVSLAIPLLHIEQAAAPSSIAGEVLLPVVREAVSAKLQIYGQLSAPTPAFSLSLADILLGFYLTGALFMLSRLSLRLLALRRLIRRSRQEQKGRYTLLTPDRDIPASSFFSYVFWKGSDLPEAKRIILEHELVHVRQRHSLDVLLMECYLILKWFNPLVYAYRTALQQVHEYIADAYVSREIGSRHTYAQFLALQRMGHSCHPLANTFAAHLRSRLHMLAQRSSAPWRAVKYLSVLPLTALLLVLFAFNLSEQLPGGGLERAGQAVDAFAQKNVFTTWGEQPEEMADALAWGPYRLPVFSPAQLSGRDNVLGATFLTPAALRALSAERFELVLGAQVLWRNKTQALLYRGSQLIHSFSVKGRLKDCWPTGVGMEEDLVLVLAVEDAWGRLSCSIIGLGEAYSDDLRVAMMEAGVYAMMKVAGSKAEGKKTELCVALADEHIQKINTHHPWESSPYRLQLGQELLGVQWYNHPFTSTVGAVIQEVEPGRLARIKNTSFQITKAGQSLEVEQLYISLIKKSGPDRILEAASPGEVQEIWRQATAALSEGDQLHLLARTTDEKAFYTSLGIGVSPEPGRVFQDGLFSERYGEFSRRKVDQLPRPKAWLRRSGTEIQWGDYHWVLRQRDGRASEAVRYLPAEALTALSTAAWSATFNGEAVGADSLMLWSYDRSDEGMKFTPLFSEAGQRRLRVAAQRTDAFELQVVFGLDNGADRGRLVLKINQERPIAAEADTLRLKPSLDPFQFVYRPGAPTLIRLDTSVAQHRWMYEQYANDPKVNVLPIPGFRTVERLRREGEAIVPEPEIGRVELLHATYIDTDTIPEYYELYDKAMTFHWRGLSGTRSNEAQSLRAFQHATEGGMLLEIGGLEYPVLQFELVIIPEDGKGVTLKSKSAKDSAVQQHIADLKPNSSLFLTDIVIRDTDGQQKRLPVTFSFNLK